MAQVKFSKTHEWISIEDDIATVGITDYAQKELGDIVFIELPAPGDVVTQGAGFGTIESTKAANELYSPLSGAVVEMNSELVDNPQWINEDPQGKGWMVKIKMSNEGELEGLLDEAGYQEFIAQEAH